MSLVQIFPSLSTAHISVWIHKNDAIEFPLYRALSGRFFSRQKLQSPISKGDDIKIKRKVSHFFLLLPVYLPFIAVHSLFFARLHGLEAAQKFSEIIEK